MAPWASLLTHRSRRIGLRFSVCRRYQSRCFAKINAIGKNGGKHGEDRCGDAAHSRQQKGPQLFDSPGGQEKIALPSRSHPMETDGAKVADNGQERGRAGVSHQSGTRSVRVTHVWSKREAWPSDMPMPSLRQDASIEKGLSIGAITRLLNVHGVSRRAQFGCGTSPRDSAHQDWPREEWIEMPVPAIVTEECFALAQECFHANKVHAPCPHNYAERCSGSRCVPDVPVRSVQCSSSLNGTPGSMAIAGLRWVRILKTCLLHTRCWPDFLGQTCEPIELSLALFELEQLVQNTGSS